MKVTAVLCLLCALVSAPFASASGAGLQLTATAAGFDVISTILLDFINGELNSFTIPDQHIDTHVAEPIGHITLDLTDIKVTNFKISTAAIAVTAPSDFGLALKDIDFDLSMDYKYRKVNWPHVSDHGLVTAKPSDGTIGADIQFKVNAGVMSCSALSSTCSFGSFDIHFDHGASWLYNLLIDLFKGSVGKAIDSAVKSALTSAVDSGLNKALAKLPQSVTIGGGKSEATLNTSVADVQAIGSSFSIGDTFAWSDPKTSAACPHATPNIPPYTPAAQDNMLQLLIADTSLSCPLWVQYNNHALDFVLDPTTVPKAKSFLTTAFWSKFISPLAKYNSTVDIIATLAAEPSVTTASTTGLTVGASFGLQFNLTTPALNACTLNLTLGLGLDVFVNQTGSVPLIQFSLSDLALSFGVIDSNIGTFSLTSLDALLAFASPVIKKIIDQQLAGFGIPLPPIDGFQLVDPAVTYNPGYFAISSNMTFAP